MNLKTQDENRDWPERELAWRQKMAAYWAIAWPALLAWMIPMETIPSSWIESEYFVRFGWLFGLVSWLLFFGVQSVCVSRLISKKFRTFRIEIETKDGVVASSSRQMLNMVAARVAVPQIIFLVVWGLLPERFRHFSLFLLFFVVGPNAVQYAIAANYRHFGLRSYARRFI